MIKDKYYFEIIVHDSRISVAARNIDGSIYQHTHNLYPLVEKFISHYLYTQVTPESPYLVATCVYERFGHNDHCKGVLGYYGDQLVIELGEAASLIKEYQTERDKETDNQISQYLKDCEANRNATRESHELLAASASVLKMWKRWESVRASSPLKPDAYIALSEAMYELSKRTGDKNGKLE